MTYRRILPSGLGEYNVRGCIHGQKLKNYNKKTFYHFNRLIIS